MNKKKVFMSLLDLYPELNLVQKLCKKKRSEVYLVGGCIRDYALNRPCRDLDFAVNRNAVSFARQFAKEIKGAFVLLDKEHGCARVAKKKKKELWTFDFADFRAPDIKDDVLHRDFTINSLCIDVKEITSDASFKSILMDHNKGARDIRDKLIRMVSSETFKEDPLRLMRAFSLHALLGFKIQNQTLKQIKKDKDLLLDVSPERVRDELFKVLASDKVVKTFKAMDKVGLLSNVIPQIAIMFDVQQGGYHHLDVWPHSLETVHQCEKFIEELSSIEEVKEYLDEYLGGQRPRYALCKLAALLHDIGKPDTRRKEKNRLSFHGHEHAGKNIVRDIARMLKLSTLERHALESMVLWHLRPGYLSNFKRPSEKAIFRFFRDTKEEALSVLILSLADQRSTCGSLTSQKDQDHHEKIVRKLINHLLEKQKEQPFVCFINGDDLIKQLKLTPSPLFSRILKEVEEAQSLGRIKTKKEALALAKGLT